MNIKYNLVINKNTQQQDYLLLALGNHNVEIKSHREKSAETAVETTSFSENPFERSKVRETMDQDILVQGLEGLKISLSGRIKIRSSKFGYAWR